MCYMIQELYRVCPHQEPISFREDVGSQIWGSMLWVWGFEFWELEALGTPIEF